MRSGFHANDTATRVGPVRVRPEHIRTEWSEGHPDDGGDGYWIALKPGWRWADDVVHCIHEDTRAKAHRECVVPCACRDCCGG